MVIESTRQGNSIYDEMKSRVFDLYMMDRQSAYEAHTNIKGDELANALAVSEDAYNFNLLKLDVLASLAGDEEFIKRRFVQQKFYIEQMNISEKNKVDAILTSACILKNFGICLINRNISEEDICILAHAMVDINPSEYSFYQTIILYHVDKLISLLRSVDDSIVEHDIQYLKSQNN